MSWAVSGINEGLLAEGKNTGAEQGTVIENANQGERCLGCNDPIKKENHA
jgi:hypothetical protein